MGHRARVLGFSGLVIGLLGMNLVTIFVPDGTEYANVVDLTQDRLMETVRRIEFHKLQTGSYPSSLPAVLAGHDEPIRSFSNFPPPIPPRESPSPMVLGEVVGRPGLPFTEPSPKMVVDPLPALPPANCVKERIVHRDYAVSDLDYGQVPLPPFPDQSEDDCPIQRIVYRDRAVLVALPGSDVITDPTASSRRAFFYERIGDDRYYLRAVGPDGVAFTGDDIFPQIERMDTTRLGLLEMRQEVAAVE